MKTFRQFLTEAKKDIQSIIDGAFFPLGKVTKYKTPHGYKLVVTFPGSAKRDDEVELGKKIAKDFNLGFFAKRHPNYMLTFIVNGDGYVEPVQDQIFNIIRSNFTGTTKLRVKDGYEFNIFFGKCKDGVLNVDIKKELLSTMNELLANFKNKIELIENPLPNIDGCSVVIHMYNETTSNNKPLTFKQLWPEKKLKVSTKYAPDTFGYWWTVIRNNEDIEGGVYKGDIDCGCQKISSLKGAPKIVKGNFSCIGCYLTSLEGAPEEVSKSFKCEYNSLNDLTGGPVKVGKDYDCSDSKLKSLKGFPEEVKGNFWCGGNDKLSKEYLKELEKNVSGFVVLPSHLEK